MVILASVYSNVTFYNGTHAGCPKHIWILIKKLYGSCYKKNKFASKITTDGLHKCCIAVNVLMCC